MDTQEYVIISKTAIQKRIEELEKKSEKFYYREGIDEYDFAKEELEQILSQSIPLIPEIEKAMDSLKPYVSFTDLYEAQQDYISNLKLDI